MKPVEGRICQEELGYREFKHHRKFLYGIILVEFYKSIEFIFQIIMKELK